MNIDELERNNAVLRKTIQYVDGEVKEVVEKQIKHNFQSINEE